MILDSKPEHLHNFSSIAAEAGYDIVVMDLVNPNHSAGYNPLEYPYYLYKKGNMDAVNMEVRKIANLVVPDGIFTSDPFWTVSAKNILYGSIMALMETADESQINFASVLRFINDGAKKKGYGSMNLTKFLKRLPQNSVARNALEDYSNTAEVTAAGMRSTAIQILQDYVFSQGINLMLAGDDIKISNISDRNCKPVIYFIVLPEQNKVLSPIASLFFSQIMNRYMQIADESPDGRLSHRLNVFIDELPSLSKVLAECFPDYISTCRSRNIRIFYVIQSFSQLISAFGSQSETILDNTGTMIVFRINTKNSAKFVTDMLGQYEYVNPYSGEIITKDVMTVSDICNMDIGQAVVVSQGLRFVTWLPDYTEIMPEQYVGICATPVKVYKRRQITCFDMNEYLDNAEHNESVSSKKTDTPDIISGDELDDVFLCDKTENYIGEYNNDNSLRDAIRDRYFENYLLDYTKEEYTLIEKQAKSFTGRRIQHRYSVKILFMGHKVDFIEKAADVCGVSVPVMLDLLYSALHKATRYFFEDKTMAENFATEVKNSGGIAEFSSLYDD